MNLLGRLWLGSVLLAGWVPAQAQEEVTDGPQMLLRPVAEVLAEQQELMSMPVVRAGPHHKQANTSKNLLPYLNYDPAERSQRSCGNCWQWACTAEIEIMLNVRYGIFNRLSVQLISSCYSSNGCCNEGGAGGHFADFYNIRKYFIPWSNPNANWRNGGGSCSVACSDIGTSFKYPIQSIQDNRIETQGVSQDTAIQNIKSVLDQNRAVCFWFAVPNNGGIDFTNFWHSMPEAVRWDPSRHNGTILSNGVVFAHGVACVGYDDSNPTNRYWLMLNSWGNPDQRSNGLFRVRMDVDYSACSTVTNLNAPNLYMYQFLWSCFDVTFDDPEHWDDIYESQYGNDTRTSATEFSYHWARTWLSAIWGGARQYNDDWYQIELIPGKERIDAQCAFTNAAGDIDMDLVDETGAVLASSRTTNNTETLSKVISTPGTYYLHIYGKANPGTAGRNTGNAYDLWWQDTMDDDAYEDNDSLSTASSIQKATWLSATPEGIAKQYDGDWYKLPVRTDQTSLSVTCTFTHADGDLDIALYNTGGRVMESATARSVETINALIATHADYYIYVCGHGGAGNQGNAYDLKWDTSYVDDAYEKYMERPYPDNGLDAWAYDPGYDWRGVWLSTIAGKGRQYDEDWYKIQVVDYQQPVVVTCSFTHAEGDLQLVVDNMGSTFYVVSSGSDDGEALSFNAPSNGAYYICVRAARGSGPSGPWAVSSTGSRYDLRWTNGDGGEGADDAYEENDTLGTAFDLSTNEAAWLSTVAGVGRQRDQDWFRISATTDHLRIVSTCRFTHAEGNIDLALYNAGGRIVDSLGATNEEVIDFTVATTGTYYLAVLAGSSGGYWTNAYDLWWAALDSTPVLSDDAYEENDELAAAYDLRARPGEWLSPLAGYGAQADQDWYEIETLTDGERIVATCSFVNAEGNIDLALYNTGGRLADSLGIGDGEAIDYEAATAGTYYLLVIGGTGGNQTNIYDLWWSNLRPPVVPTDDAYEENDVFGTANAPGDAWKGHWLSEVNGAGILADDDWYRFTVPQGLSHVVITCAFTHAEGNVDIYLYNAGGRIAESTGTGNMEVIDSAVPGAGEYAIAVDGAYATNAYDLWWDTAGRADDAYEENDSRAAAYFPGYDWTGQWLSGIGGAGLQWNDDWYRVEVAPNAMLLAITCSFTHAEGDIDLTLHDMDGVQLAISAGVSDGEAIRQRVPRPGTYYLRVYGYASGNSGSAYDLLCQAEASDDAYEENDSRGAAWNLGADDGIWLSSFYGPAVQGDEDWYQFTVMPDRLQISATCSFTHAEGNLDMALYSESGELAVSQGLDGEEAIHCLVPTSGVYYLQVSGENLSNSYDLYWITQRSLTPAVPAIVAIRLLPGGAREIEVRSEQGRLYRLEGTSNLLDGASWTQCAADVATAAETFLHDTNVPAPPSLYFYRVGANPVLPPQDP